VVEEPGVNALGQGEVARQVVPAVLGVELEIEAGVFVLGQSLVDVSLFLFLRLAFLLGQLVRKLLQVWR